MNPRARHVLSVIVWLAAVVLIALGGAGIVAATDPGTGRASQARLTYSGDAELTPALDAAEADLSALADDVDALGTQARGALAATIGGDTETARTAVAGGNGLLVGIASRSSQIAADLAGIPYVRTAEAPLHVSPAVRARYARLQEALRATDGLQSAWDGLTIASAAAGLLAAQLAEHDRLVGEAAAEGRDAKYAKAIKTLKAAGTIITESRTSRDQLARSVDVTVLDQWLDRNAAYDKALAALYDALDSVGGKVTNKVRRAVAAEKAARAKLPPDSRGLVVIMGDLAQGGLNSAVVTIEEAKAALADGLEPAADEASPAP